jgi:hypothetical protein
MVKCGKSYRSPLARIAGGIRRVAFRHRSISTVNQQYPQREEKRNQYWI